MSCQHTDCPDGGPCRYYMGGYPPAVVPAAGVTHSPDYRSAPQAPFLLGDGDMTPAHPSVIQAQRDAWKAECEAARAEAARRTADVDELQRRLTAADDQSARRLDALEAAERARDAAIVAGAVQLAAAREALQRIADGWRAANGGCLICQQADGQPHREACPAPEVNDALSPLDGGGNVRAGMDGEIEVRLKGYRSEYSGEMWGIVATQPSLPSAEAALAEAFTWAYRQHMEAGTSMPNLTKAWLERTGR